MGRRKIPLTELECPCGSGRRYGECCQPYHAGAAAPTPEALMRSRYSAYVLGLDDYVLATWAPETRPAALFSRGQARPKWFRLVVHGSDAAQATVHFTALARTSTGVMRLEEKSRFRQENGRWVYVDGDVSPEAND